jgi:hypothetical protein
MGESNDPIPVLQDHSAQGFNIIRLTSYFDFEGITLTQISYFFRFS